MTSRDLPYLEHVFESGPKDWFYDILLLIAPVVIALLVLTGRSVVTSGVVVAYLLSFVSYVLYKGIR